MAASDIVRRITITGSTQGVDQAAASLEKLATAQGDVAVAVERSSKAQLSAQAALDRLQRSVDAEFRSEQQLAAAETTLARAREQGLITAQREAQLLDLASAKYRAAGESAEFMARGIETASEISKGLIAGLGAGVLLTGLAELPSKIIETVKSAAELKDTAETIGLTADELQKLDYVGQQSGNSIDMMNTALERFSTNLGKAEKGTGDLYDILKANHVVLSGDVLTDFESYANLVANATSAEQKNLLVTAAFGRNAQSLGSVFNGGAEGIRNLAEEAANAGVILSDNTLDAAKELNAEFMTMQTQLGTTFEEFIVSIGPALELALKGITVAAQAASAAVQFGTFAGEQALPIAERSTAHIEQDLAQQQTLLSRLQAGNSGQSLVKNAAGQFVANPNYNPMRVTANPGQVTALQQGVEADQAELAQRRAAAVAGFADQNGGAGWGILSKPTVTPTQAATAAADEQQKAIARVTDQLNLQLKTLTETDRQKAIDEDLDKAKVSSSSAEGKAIADLSGKLYDQEQAIKAVDDAWNFAGQTGEAELEKLLEGSESVTDAVKNMATALLQAALQAELLGQGPLAGILGTTPATSGAPGGLLGSIASAFGLGAKSNAAGGVYQSPDLSRYTNQVVSEPTFFRFAKGGVFGEAGPEAIMPLTRGPDGRLGVSAGNSNEPLAVSVSIVHQPGAGDSATATRNGNQISIRAVVGTNAAQDMQTPGSPTNRTMRTTFGLKPALRRRAG